MASVRDESNTADTESNRKSRRTRLDSVRGGSRPLYETLEVSANATDDEIKKAYRRLALKYHPDKNLEGDLNKTEKFKEINYANSILSNPSKRRIYDEYGEMGVKLIEQFGDDDKILQLVFKPWFKWVFLFTGLSTCCCFFCCCGCLFCCNCCCNFCCGKFKPKDPYFNEAGTMNPDWFEEDNEHFAMQQNDQTEGNFAGNSGNTWTRDPNVAIPVPMTSDAANVINEQPRPQYSPEQLKNYGSMQ